MIVSQHAFKLNDLIRCGLLKLFRNLSGKFILQEDPVPAAVQYSDTAFCRCHLPEFIHEGIILVFLRLSGGVDRKSTGIQGLDEAADRGTAAGGSITVEEDDDRNAFVLAGSLEPAELGVCLFHDGFVIFLIKVFLQIDLFQHDENPPVLCCHVVFRLS